MGNMLLNKTVQVRYLNTNALKYTSIERQGSMSRDIIWVITGTCGDLFACTRFRAHLIRQRKLHSNIVHLIKRNRNRWLGKELDRWLDARLDRWLDLLAYGLLESTRWKEPLDGEWKNKWNGNELDSEKSEDCYEHQLRDSEQDRESHTVGNRDWSIHNDRGRDRDSNSHRDSNMDSNMDGDSNRISEVWGQ